MAQGNIWKFGSSESSSISGDYGDAPMNVTDITIRCGDQKINLNWKDSDGSFIDGNGSPLCVWAGTKVVYRTDRYPENPDDGVLVIDSKIKNAYEANSLEISNLTNDTDYYISLFPYSTKGSINVNEKNRIKGIPCFSLKASFADATDKQLEAMINAHYSGEIDLSTIWHVGDTRKFHINAIPADSNNETPVSEQDMMFVILDFNHDSLVTKIGDKTKAIVTIQTREVLGNNGNIEALYYFGKTMNDGGYSNWGNIEIRTWCNNNFKKALPTTLQSLMKETTRKSIGDRLTTSPLNIVTTNDYVFLLSYPEVKGTVTDSSYLKGKSVSNYEGTQYEYYKTTANIQKYINMNGDKSDTSFNGWGLRSPSSDYSSEYGNSFMSMRSATYCTGLYGNYKMGIAPAFCL